MSKIFIFYALIEEGKGKQLSLNGPFIHYKPTEDSSQLPEENYLFDKEDYNSEKRFLSRMLRQKSPAKISIFHYYDLSVDSSFNVKCSTCGMTYTVGIDKCGGSIICGACETKRLNKIERYEKSGDKKSLEKVGEKVLIKIPTLEEVGEKVRQRAMFEAEDYFENKFEQMKNNYAVCNRKR